MSNIFNKFQSVGHFCMHFFLYAGGASWAAFYNIYLLDQGFSGPQIGWITGVMQSTAFFFIPIWGMWADRFGTKKMLVLALFIDLILIQFLGLIHGFVFLLLFIVALTFFNHPLGALADVLSVRYSQTHPRISYGQFRAGGSLGWAIGTLIMGKILLEHSTSIIFPTAGAFFVILLILLLFINEQNDAVATGFHWREFIPLVHNRRFVFFMILLFLYGICNAPLNLFINIYFHELGATNQQIGIAFAVQAFAEAPLFFLSMPIIRKLGAARIILATMIITIVRVFLYSTASTPWQAIPLGLLHCLTFSLFWAASTDLTGKLVPEKLRGTGQALLWAFHLGAGITVGNIIIGYFYESHGMMFVMQLCGYCISLLLLGFIVFFRFNKDENKA